MKHISEVIKSAFPWIKDVKQCSKCQEWKPVERFYRLASNKDGRRPDCKDCEGKPARTIADKDRFFAKVKKIYGGCWEWQGSTATNNGYGRFWVNGRHIVAHRYSWKLAGNRLPKGKVLCHTCDNPKCVNPKHLFVGTQKDNSHDMLKKGRHRPMSGEDHPSCKISSKIAREIRRKYASGSYSQKHLASLYGISQTQVGRIVRGESWNE